MIPAKPYSLSASVIPVLQAPRNPRQLIPCSLSNTTLRTAVILTQDIALPSSGIMLIATLIYLSALVRPVVCQMAYQDGPMYTVRNPIATWKPFMEVSPEISESRVGTLLSIRLFFLGTYRMVFCPLHPSPRASIQVRVSPPRPSPLSPWEFHQYRI